jgi:glycosyltransferase involved in cell wall biosynthesis
MTTPFVSVLIDTYNHERFIEQAIASALEQDFSAADREIIVVDDGSTDGTAAIVRKFAPEVRLIQKPNGGQGSAFNAGIPECRGEVVAFLDGDDWWAKNKLSRVVPVLAGNSEIGMVGHGTIKMLPDGREFTEVLKEDHRFSIRTIEGAQLFERRKSFLGTRTTIRANILRKLLPVPEAIRIEADEFVFTMAAAFGDVEILPEALFYYRLHADNFFSQQGFKAANVKRKHESLVQLAASLAERLPATGISPKATELLVEGIQVEADQLRLSVEGGGPWETVRTELAMYRILYSNPPWGHRLFKYMTLLPAYLVSPRTYYSVRRNLAASEWYRRLRKVFFPIPTAGHVDHSYTTRT